MSSLYTATKLALGVFGRATHTRGRTHPYQRKERAVRNRFATSRAKLRVAALTRAGGTCEWVGCDVADGVEVHHVVPVAEGGSDDLRNLRVLCAEHRRQVRELRGRSDRWRIAR